MKKLPPYTPTPSMEDVLANILVGKKDSQEVLETFEVVAQKWQGLEATHNGVMFDGVSIHLTREDCVVFIGKNTTDIYKPEGEPYVAWIHALSYTIISGREGRARHGARLGRVVGLERLRKLAAEPIDPKTYFS